MNVGFVMDEGQASPTDEFRVFYVTIRAACNPGHGSRMYDHSAMENLVIRLDIISKFRDSQFDLVKRKWAANFKSSLSILSSSMLAFLLLNPRPRAFYEHATI